MVVLELKDLSEDGVFFEDSFEQKFRAYDWSRFDNQAVRVSNCGLDIVPGWVYLTVGIELAKRARKIFFGDAYEPKRIFKRGEAAAVKEDHNIDGS